MKQPKVTIIGTGALGSALAKALHSAGYPIQSVYNRTVAEAKSLSKEINAPVFSTFPQSATDLGTIVFLAVPDREILECAKQLADLSNDYSGYCIVHCSGHLPAEILDSLREKNAAVAAFHPLQTFTTESGQADFKDIYFDVEGDKQAMDILQQVADRLDAHTLAVSKEGKKYLHAAAVMASNYLLALLESSGKIAAMGDINEIEARKALMPLVRTSLANAREDDLARVLTGPIKRGDIDTVRGHLELLKDDKILLNLYKKLGLQTLELAMRSEELSSDNARELSQLFDL